MKAGTLSIWIKVIGAVVLLGSLVLKGFGIWGAIGMGEVIAVVGALEALVLPIDISKIKQAGAKL